MTPPDIWYRTQRLLRTVVQVLLAALTVWAAFAAIAPQILTELATILPGSWIVWLTGVVAAITVVAGVLTRIMAIPAVNGWLTKLGLGSVPKSALGTILGEGGFRDTYVAPDPKARFVPGKSLRSDLEGDR